MIDLDRTRAGLLAAIEAPQPGSDALTDLTDPRSRPSKPSSTSFCALSRFESVGRWRTSFVRR